MTPYRQLDQHLLAREELVRCIEHATAIVLTSGPVALCGLPAEALKGYLFITVGMAMLRIASGAAAWVVRTKL